MTKWLSVFLLPALVAAAQIENPRFVSFRDDAGTGVSATKKYTHAVNFGFDDDKGTLLNGVFFWNTSAAAGMYTAADGRSYGWQGFPSGKWAGNPDAIATPEGNTVRNMLYHFVCGDGQGTIKLTGLTPGRWYEVSFFLRAWQDNVSRWQSLTFFPGTPEERKVEFNQDARIDDRLLVFRYRANEAGELVVFQRCQDGNPTYSLCIPAFVNEELPLITATASDIRNTSATLHARLENDIQNATGVTAFWGSVDAGVDATAWQGSAPATKNKLAFSHVLDALTPETFYAFRLMAAMPDGTTYWSNLGTFTTFGADPVIEVLPPVKIGGTNAVLATKLVYAGESGRTPVTLHWGVDLAQMRSANLGVKTASAFTNVLAGLDYGQTYHYFYKAGNAVSATNTFSTLGGAVFGAPRATALSDALRPSVMLVTPGAGPASVACYTGADAARATTRVHTWEIPANSANTPLACVVRLPAGAERWFVFEAKTTLPNGKILVNRTEPISGVAGVRELVWDFKAGYPGWDTSHANWHTNGAEAGTATFRHGDSARFGWFVGTLAEDLDVADLRVEVADKQAWSLSGDRTLTLSGTFSIADTGNSADNALHTRLAGSGSVLLESGVFRLSHTNNTFSGGVVIRGGSLTAATLGTGAVEIGSPVRTDAPAVLNITAPLIAGPLKLAGGKNAGKLNLSATTNATFASLAQSDGATLQLTAASNVLAFARQPAGPLPPWMVGTAEGGHYLAAREGRVIPYPDATFLGEVLSANRAIPAARFTRNADLGGHTLTLGGAILAKDTTLTNGTLNLTGNTAYFYVGEGNASISAKLAGNACVVKFGAGNLALTDFGTRDLCVQEGILNLAPSADLTTPAKLSGAGSFVVRDNVVTLTREGDMPLHNLHLHSGGLTLGKGVHILQHHGFTAGPVAWLLPHSAGSRMTLRDGARWTQSASQNFNFASALHQQHIHAINHHLLVTGAGTTLDLNGGHLTFGATHDWTTKTYDNSITITAGAVVTNAAAIHVAHNQGGGPNRFTLSGGARVYTGGAGIANAGGGWLNTVLVTGRGTVWNNGGGGFTLGNTQGGMPSHSNLVLIASQAIVTNVANLYVGHRWGHGGHNIHDNTLVISNNAAFHLNAGHVWIGHNLAGYIWGNSLVLCDGAVLNAPGNPGYGVSIGYADGASIANSLRIETGARIEALNHLHIGIAGWNNTAFNNAELLNGGRLTFNGAENSGILIGRAMFHDHLNFGGGASTNNFMRIASSNPARPSILDLNGASITIGQGTARLKDDINVARNNTLRLDPGGVLQNVGAINVGTAEENSLHNAFVLAGGKGKAASLTIAPGNRLDIVVGAEGFPEPFIVSGSVTFAVSSIIAPYCADESAAGKTYVILKSDEPIDTSRAMLRGSQMEFGFRLSLSEDKKELSLNVIKR